ncbi:32606_t:CDS:1, partial [Gigaspora margarita]
MLQAIGTKVSESSKDLILVSRLKKLHPDEQIPANIGYCLCQILQIKI